MKRPLFYSILLAMALSVQAEPLPVVPPESVGLSSDKLAKIDEVVEKFIAQKELAGGVVAVARRGKIAHLKAYGKRNQKTGEAMTEDTIFRIYSMSKSVTTAAALMLVEEGKLELKGPVSNYLPALKGAQVASGSEKVAPKRPMTVEYLMRHTAGLTYGLFGDTEVDKAYQKAGVLNGSLEDMEASLGELPLLYHPGERWVYSVATDVLGRLVEKASGKSFGDFLEDRLFKPLKMKDTGFHVPADKVDRFAANHTKGWLSVRFAG